MRLSNFVMIATLGALLFVRSACATKYAQPKLHTVSSPNGMFQLVVDPSKLSLTVLREGAVVWMVSVPAIWHEDYLLSNDGLRIVKVSWKFCSVPLEGTAGITVINADGSERSTPILEVSTPTQKFGVGPIGDFWRAWRDGKAAWANEATDAVVVKVYDASDAVTPRVIPLPNLES